MLTLANNCSEPKPVWPKVWDGKARVKDAQKTKLNAEAKYLDWMHALSMHHRCQNAPGFHLWVLRAGGGGGAIFQVLYSFLCFLNFSFF